MAAQDLTAAALLDVQARLSALFAEGQTTPSRYERNSQVDTQTAAALLRNHVANTSPITDANGNCVGFEAHFLQGAADTLDYDGDGAELSLDCDIPSGDGIRSDKELYGLNLRKIKNRTLNDDLCGNLFRDGVAQNTRDEVASLVAENLFFGMQAIHKSLNTEFINFLDSNKTSVNNDPSLPSGITFGSSTFTINESILSTLNPDTLTDLETIAANNYMTNWFYIAGRRHFYNAFVNSQYKTLNDDQRSEIRWGQTPLSFDVKNLDSLLSGSNSFIVDPGSYIFYDHVDPALTEVPFQVDENKWEFSANDPFLMVNTASGMRPLRYTVHYQKLCSNVNISRMRNQFDHHFRIILNAGLHLAPTAADGATGILKFKSA